MIKANWYSILFH